MLPTNNAERETKFRRFGLYYALSVAAICVLVFAFADGLNNNGSGGVSVAENGSRSAALVFSADSLLHRQFSVLENTDDQYALALDATKTREGMRVADSLRRILPSVEQNFQFTLDSISRLSRLGSGTALRQTVDYFAAALSLRAKRNSLPRNAAKTAPAPIAATPAMTTDELIKNNPELKEEMIKKDIRIADLEAKLTGLKKSGAPNSPDAGADSKAATLKLQQDYDDLQKNYKALTETNTRLRSAAAQPAAATASRETAESDAAKTARIRALKMEQQLQEMNADLSFSTVDCNLSRADVNQIIYNGKQRKVLLQQALDILTALKKSSDEDVQKRAMQKISQLNRIAMTVRD